MWKSWVREWVTTRPGCLFADAAALEGATYLEALQTAIPEDLIICDETGKLVSCVAGPAQRVKGSGKAKGCTFSSHGVKNRFTHFVSAADVARGELVFMLAGANGRADSIVAVDHFPGDVVNECRSASSECARVHNQVRKKGGQVGGGMFAGLFTCNVFFPAGEKLRVAALNKEVRGSKNCLHTAAEAQGRIVAAIHKLHNALSSRNGMMSRLLTWARQQLPVVETLYYVIASLGLMNSGHLDTLDSSQCFALWTMSAGSYFVEGAFLVFPWHGLAIELTDGIAVSWDGREALHATSAHELRWTAAKQKFHHGEHPWLMSFYMGRSSLADKAFEHSNLRVPEEKDTGNEWRVHKKQKTSSS